MLLSLAAGGIGLATARGAQAGGGPENVMLVVNPTSDDSKTIANHYIELRSIPAGNVVYVPWPGSKGAIKGDNFRNRILMPVLKAIEERKLNAQIDYVVYSSDFPWRIDLQNLFPDHAFQVPFDPAASITGATYLAPYVVNQSPAIVMPTTNWYVPAPMEPNQVACKQLANLRSRGFRSAYLWDAQGNRTKQAKAGQRYLLSTMLAVTDGRGNSVPEVLHYLRRAKSADGTNPRGTIYFMANKDVRSQTRDKCYPTVAAQIQQLGIRATVQQGTIPRNARDVMGLMAGVEFFDWSDSGSTILPGAICEHLTSNGGVMRAGASQTPLSEFLRHGAAAASGTIKEPRAIQAKFPLPSLQLHYARGCSLAEAFYQSITGPYQILIVGDPLCQPWARFPTVSLSTIDPGQEVQGALTITPSGSAAGREAIASFELFVDGRLAARSRPGQSISLDTNKLADGYHELRVVGVASGTVETRGRQVVPIVVRNHDAAVELDVSPAVVARTGKLSVSVRHPGATAITIRQNHREVGRVQGEAGEVEISAANLGSGPTSLQAYSEGDTPAVSPPVRIRVE